MIEAVEIVEGAWVFQNSDGERNWGTLLGEPGALIIDPGSRPDEIDAARRFVADMSSSVAALAYTQQPDVRADTWADVQQMDPASRNRRSPLMPGYEGWEAIPLFSSGSGHMVVFSAAARIIFCGEMLSGGEIPVLGGSSQQYIDNLDKIDELQPKIVVPLHGKVAQGGRAVRERIELERNYLYALRRHVMSTLAMGATLDRALQVAAELYEDRPFIEDHLRNLRLTWDELRDAEQW